MKGKALHRVINEAVFLINKGVKKIMKLAQLNDVIDKVVKKIEKWTPEQKRDVINNIDYYTADFTKCYHLPDYDVAYVRQQLLKRIK